MEKIQKECPHCHKLKEEADMVYFLGYMTCVDCYEKKKREELQKKHDQV